MKLKTISVILGALAVVGIVGLGCGHDSGTGASGSTSSSGGGAITIIGAGSTFVNPAMSKWGDSYAHDHAGVNLNYQSVGSGAGIAQYKAGTVDFGASDAPLSDKELGEMPTPTVQIPVTAGCEVLAFNLSGIASGLKLPEDVVADIYLGKIKSWADPRITAANPDVKLPATDITVAHRSDGSGTTYIFTDYLSSVSPGWNGGPGKGKTVDWPVGVGGKGNEGVAGLVKATPGSIGYVELAYAVQTKLTYCQVRNKSGNYVSPTVASTSAAVDAAADALKTDIRASIVNGTGKDVYPIAGMTYAIISKAPKDSKKAGIVLDFLKWVLGDGQAQAKDLNYAPLPKRILDLDMAALASVQVAK